MRIRATMIAALTLVIPASVMAQDQTLPTAAPVMAASPDSAVQGPAPGVRKRRGSMVGYIEDGSIRTQIRVRFDAGFGVDSPDRAEFFYGKCGCYRGLAGTPLFDPDAPGPGPGILTDLDYQSFRVMGEFALSDRFSVFADVPFRSIKPQSFAGTGAFGNQSGLGDVDAGVKLGLVSDDRRNLTVLVRGSFPTGDSEKGLGTDHSSIEPALLYRQDISDRVSIESQFGEWHPIGGSQGPLVSDGKFAGDVLYYGIGPSVDVVRTDTFRFTPVVELVGWHVMNGFQTSTLLTPTGPDAGGINIVNLKIGARTTFKNGGSLYAGFGWGLTDSVWYDKVLRIEYRAGF
jgi:hypothetical protein